MHPGTPTVGAFNCVIHTGEDFYYMYFFNKSLKASHQGISFPITTEIVSVETILSLPETICSISLELVAFHDYKIVIADILRELKQLVKTNDEHKVSELEKKYTSPNSIEKITAKELTTNELVKSLISKKVGGMGFSISTNKAKSGTPRVNPCSRFFKSRPDLVIMHNCNCIAAVVQENGGDDADTTLFAATSENKLSGSADTDILQLQGNMEKVAGDLVHHHLLTNTPKKI